MIALPRFVMTKREKLCATIRALLAKTVANGCTEQEAMEAARVAAKLLAKHNLTIDEVEMRESPFTKHTERRDDLVGERLWKPATAIAKLTGARFWGSPHGMVSEITFFGFEHEVLVATYMLALCSNAMRDQEKRQRASMRLLTATVQRRRLVPFLDGMADRLHQRILDMVPPAAIGTGLVVLHQALIDAALEEQGISLRQRDARPSRDFEPGYGAGLRAGDRVSLNAGLTGNSRARGLLR